MANVHKQMVMEDVRVVDLTERWSDMTHRFSVHVHGVIGECFDSMDDDVLKEVKDSTFQNSRMSLASAASELKRRLDNKYYWTDWVTLVYTNDDYRTRTSALWDKSYQTDPEARRQVIAWPLPRASCPKAVVPINIKGMLKEAEKPLFWRRLRTTLAISGT